MKLYLIFIKKLSFSLILSFGENVGCLNKNILLDRIVSPQAFV